MPIHSWSGTWQGRAPDGDIHLRARKIVLPTGGIVRGKFPSRKNGRMVHHEGLLELDAIYLFEASSLIAKYREQPETIRYPDGPRIRRYTPDFELTLATGELVLVEVKPRRGMCDPEVRHKLDQVAQYLRRSEKSFVILDDETLRSEPRQSNVRAIYHHAPRVPQTAAACRASMTRNKKHFPISMASALSLRDSENIEPYSLMLNGLVRCDLSQPIGPETLLHIPKENDDAWFCLAQEYGF